MSGTVLSSLFDIVNLGSAVVASTVLPVIGSILDLGFVPLALLMGSGAGSMALGS
ncbi:hypothetical protein [Nocardia sp. NPDC051570]|uniref:hypothetical protein n=1 Tax=Nocardia sp. NPDC051570 TaxID=3364324 RepID=UPI0037A727FF